MKKYPLTLAPYELDLMVEALQTRAARLEGYGRAKPSSASVNDRKADAMRHLAIALKSYRANGKSEPQIGGDK